MAYLIYHNEQQTGPVDDSVIQEMIARGDYPETVLLWQEGMADWTPANTLLPIQETRSEIIPVTSPVVEAEVVHEESFDDRVENAIDNAISRLISDEQDPAAVRKIVAKVSDLLTSGESIEYVCVQKKPVVTIFPDAIILTNRRFILARPKLTGFTFDDFQWRQVHDIHLSEQMLGATISCVIVGGKRVQLDSIPKKQARRVYAYAQQVEEHMIEERRERSMEEKRAAAGGVVIQNAVGNPQLQQSSQDDPMAQLSKLKQMHDAGLIDAGEFESKKAEILSRM